MVGGIANKRLNQDLIDSITTHKKHYFRSNKHVYAGLRSMILDYRSVFCNYRDNSIFNNIFVILWPSYLLVFLLVIIKFLFFIKWTKSAFSKMCNAMYILCYHFLSEPQQIIYSDCCVTPNEPFFSHIMVRTSYIHWNDDEFRFLQNQHAELDIYCASLLK